MARRTFFSFHYERDVTRANVVRNSWLTKPDREASGFFDASLWEESKKQGDAAIKRMIDDGLRNTSVTVVLIGRETAGRSYVVYEIERSIDRGNGLLGVQIHAIKNLQGVQDEPGSNPLPSGVPVYRWFKDDGYVSLGSWIEQAAQRAGR
jgi:hypothetical protein